MIYKYCFSPGNRFENRPDRKVIQINPLNNHLYKNFFNNNVGCFVVYMSQKGLNFSLPEYVRP